MDGLPPAAHGGRFFKGPNGRFLSMDVVTGWGQAQIAVVLHRRSRMVRSSSPRLGAVALHLNSPLKLFGRQVIPRRRFCFLRSLSPAITIISRSPATNRSCIKVRPEGTFLQSISRPSAHAGAELPFVSFYELKGYDHPAPAIRRDIPPELTYLDDRTRERAPPI